MAEFHDILFNMQILYSLALGIWAAVLAAQKQPLSGNYWGAIATFVGLVLVTAVVGLVLTMQGFRPRDGRLGLYFLYMVYLLIIMPGLFSLLRGRDDHTAALAFAVLGFFNASVAFSMQQRGMVDAWLDQP